jgi:protein-L-isoaspartate(D-aspartate) O-methyltransferase
MKHLIYCSLYTLFILLSLTTCGQNSNPFPALRNRMVKTQIEARGITDEKILEAFRNVERHRFVLPRYIPYAYNDTPLPIDEGQTISQPYIVAFMTDVLNLKKSEKVLEIGTGSGYQAAILAELCDSVFTIEIFETLGEKASSLLQELGYTNIWCKVGDGYKGWPEHAPFDAIIVTCAPGNIPAPLKDQLAEGGRMIIPVGNDPVQHLLLLKKRKEKITRESILPVRFVPMIDSKGNPY